MGKYNGHKNWNHWNVSLWINNDEGLYNLVRQCIRETQNRGAAAQLMLEALQGMDNRHAPTTPDGAPYSISSIRAAMVGM